VNSWDDDGWARPAGAGAPPGPDGSAGRRRPGSNWGCALAAIIGSIATVIVAIIVLKLLASMINVGDLMP
jgi:hypothetical protein